MRDRFHRSGLADVLIMLGPDLTARQWAAVLSVAPSVVLECAESCGATLAGDKRERAIWRALAYLEEDRPGAARGALLRGLTA